MRPLGAGTAALTVAASMVGTGVFTTTGFLIGDIGSPMAVLLGWTLGGIVSLAGALCYAELGAAFPENGGETTLIARVFSPVLGFAVGLITLLVGFAAPTAAAGLAFARYLGAAGYLAGIDERLVAVGLIVACTAVHALRVQAGAFVLNGVTLVQLVAVVVMAVVGLWWGDVSHLSAGPPVSEAVGTSPFAVGLIYIGFTYAGWNAAAYLAGEIDRPGRNLPLGLVLGTLGVTGLYLALNIGILMAAPAEMLAGKLEVAHIAAVALGGPVAGRVLSLVVAFGLWGSVLAYLLTGSRVAEALGLDHPRLGWLARRSGSGGPGNALGLLAVLSIGLAWIAAFDWLVEWVGFVLSATAMLTVVGLLWSRWREPARERPFRTPFAWVVVAVFVVPTVWSLVHTVATRPASGLAGLLTLLLALLPYVWLGGTARRRA